VRCHSVNASLHDGIEQITDCVLHFDGVTQRLITVDGVAVCSAVFCSRDVTCLFELRYDPLHRAFGDANAEGDLAQADTWTLGQTDKHMRVVAQEGPALHWLRHSEWPTFGARMCVLRSTSPHVCDSSTKASAFDASSLDRSSFPLDGSTREIIQ